MRMTRLQELVARAYAAWVDEFVRYIEEIEEFDYTECSPERCKIEMLYEISCAGYTDEEIKAAWEREDRLAERRAMAWA